MALSKHKFHILTAMFVLIAFMLGCNEFMVVGNLSLIAKSYNESLTQISWLVSIFAWTYAIATPILALVTNHFHKYYLLVTLLLIFLGGTILSSFAPSFTWLLISRVITASVAGLIESLLSVIACQLSSSKKQRSMTVAWIYTGFSIASVVGVPLGSFIADHWRWQDAFIMVTVITVLATIVTFTILPKNLKGGQGDYHDQLVLFKDKNIWLGIILDIFSTGAIYGYYTYIRPIITQTLGFTLSQLIWILLFLGVCAILANQFSGWLASRSGMKNLLPIYLINLVLLAFFSLSMQNKWTGFAMLCVLGFSLYLFGTPLQVYFLDVSTKKYPQAIMLASTLNAIFWNVGVAVSSPIAGQTLKYFGLANLGWLSFIFMAIATVILLVLLKKSE